MAESVCTELPERGVGQVDQVRVHSADIRMRQQCRELLAVSASELDDSPAMPERLSDRDRVPLKQRNSARVMRYHGR